MYSYFITLPPQVKYFIGILPKRFIHCDRQIFFICAKRIPSISCLLWFSGQASYFILSAMADNKYKVILVKTAVAECLKHGCHTIGTTKSGERKLNKYISLCIYHNAYSTSCIFYQIKFQSIVITNNKVGRCDKMGKKSTLNETKAAVLKIIFFAKHCHKTKFSLCNIYQTIFL